MKCSIIRLLLIINTCQALLYCTPHNFIITSVPKSGTHLLAKFINLLTNKEPSGGRFMFKPATPEELIQDLAFNSHYFLIYHIPYDTIYEQKLIENNFKILLITRDPRDFIVSATHWTLVNPHAFPQFKGFTFNEILLSYCEELPYAFSTYLGWKASCICYATTFEKLVGERGGGDKNTQITEMQNIARHLGYTLTNEKAEVISSQLFGGSATFREGKIGSWKTNFTAVHKESFKKNYGQLLIDLGYESNSKW